MLRCTEVCTVISALSPKHTCAHLPMHALNFSVNPFIWRVCVHEYPCMLVCLCDPAFCLSTALQSTSCILTQSLRHKWEHQNLSAVSHTVVLRERQREGGRWGEGWPIYLHSLLPPLLMFASPHFSLALPLPFFRWQIEAQGWNVAWLNISDWLSPRTF